MSPEELVFFWLLGLAGLCLLYFAPSIIAFRRGHPNRWFILVVNVFLGSTSIGWGVALIWALHVVHRTSEAAGSHGGESGLNLFANDVQPVRLIGSSKRHGGLGVDRLTTAAAVAEIERLSALLAAGHLSEAEFTELKAAVLARLRPG